MDGRHGNARADVASFHRVRPRLFGIAYRVLGNRADADDVVQDTWVRWQGTDRTVVRDPAAFLATTTTRLAINMKQSASARRVTCIGSSLPDVIDTAADPCRSAEQSDMLEHAAVLLLAKLTPAERAVFVLREAFDYPYRRIAEVLELSEANARQIHKRACAHLSAADRNAVEHHRPAAARRRVPRCCSRGRSRVAGRSARRRRHGSRQRCRGPRCLGAGRARTPRRRGSPTPPRAARANHVSKSIAPMRAPSPGVSSPPSSSVPK